MINFYFSFYDGLNYKFNLIISSKYYLSQHSLINSCFFIAKKCVPYFFILHFKIDLIQHLKMKTNCLSHFKGRFANFDRTIVLNFIYSKDHIQKYLNDFVKHQLYEFFTPHLFI